MDIETTINGGKLREILKRVQREKRDTNFSTPATFLLVPLIFTQFGTWKSFARALSYSH